MSTEAEIIRALERTYNSSATRYMVNNAFVLGGYESDFLVVRRNGYVHEFEVKCSRADYFKDFEKRNRHEILKTGGYHQDQWWYNDEDGAYRKHDEISSIHHTAKRPNKFTFVVPTDLIKPQEVPKYCGLMYYNEKLKGIYNAKATPFLHKEVIDIKDALINKFYHNWRNLKKEAWYKDLETKDTVGYAIDRLKEGNIESAIELLKRIE